MKKIWILILILILGGLGYIYFSPAFEKVPPKIEILTNGYTNLKKPVHIILEDKSGIRAYSVVVKANNFEKVIAQSAEPELGKRIDLEVKIPPVIDSKTVVLKVTAIDRSKWHFFKGNKAVKEIVLKVDKTSPNTEIINNSRSIGRGGSGVAIVKITDNNLKDKYILVDNKYKFKLTPFVKDGYYIALIAWPYNEDKFDAEIVAEDEAGNKTQQHIPYYWKTRGIYKLKNKKLKITDSFIQNVAKRVLMKSGMQVPDNPVEIFKEENEVLRKINEKELYNLTKNVYDDKINSFSIRRFDPLPGSAKEAGFMELRHYFYKGDEISRAIHKGIDLAKIRHAKVYANNPGTVVGEKYIGIYGNTLVVYHKLGLYTTYSHLSEFKVNKGDKVYKGEVIARTGATGGVFGDHLHFGVYVQGIPVQPLEWMDNGWIRTFILNIIKEAKRTINQ